MPDLVALGTTAAIRSNEPGDQMVFAVPARQSAPILDLAR